MAEKEAEGWEGERSEVMSESVKSERVKKSKSFVPKIRKTLKLVKKFIRFPNWSKN